MTVRKRTRDGLVDRLHIAAAESKRTQAELAERCGLTQSYLSRGLRRGIERYETLAMVAAAFDVRADWLMWGAGERKAPKYAILIDSFDPPVHPAALSAARALASQKLYTEERLAQALTVVAERPTADISGTGWLDYLETIIQEGPNPKQSGLRLKFTEVLGVSGAELATLRNKSKRKTDAAMLAVHANVPSDAVLEVLRDEEIPDDALDVAGWLGQMKDVAKAATAS